VTRTISEKEQNMDDRDRKLRLSKVPMSNPIDIGAQVGVMRNLEFSAGGRAHRISTGTWSARRPTYDTETGQVYVRTSVDAMGAHLGPGDTTQGQPSSTAGVEGAGAPRDASTGDTSPERRRDKQAP
jgi:hypothetical protein